MRVDPKQIFHSKYGGEEPFRIYKEGWMLQPDGLYTFNQNNPDTTNDKHQQSKVEIFTRLCIGMKYYGIYFLSR